MFQVFITKVKKGQGRMKIDYELKDRLSFNDKEYLAEQLSILLLNVASYKDQINIFAGYISQTWSNEDGGLEQWETDMEFLMWDTEIGSTIRNFLENFKEE